MSATIVELERPRLSAEDGKFVSRRLRLHRALDDKLAQIATLANMSIDDVAATLIVAGLAKERGRSIAAQLRELFPDLTTDSKHAGG